MDPAKEVGGDFYDYFLIDEDHLCMVIADVSGKGVPAALFMMASKIILQSVAMLGHTPAEVLRRTNEAVCSNNEAEMFVTVWLGILELSTGKLTAANAGHEFPAIRQPGGAFELYKDKHGFVIGGMDNVRYKEYEIQLHPGSKLFVYTDGVAEATNTEEEMYGTERMLEALNIDPEAAPQEILRNVRASVDSFVKDAEQFDDLTMLCVEYRGGTKAFVL
jgi:sigma-B regulation protein RsbU (phosphoserine phosphatase)